MSKQSEDVFTNKKVYKQTSSLVYETFILIQAPAESTLGASNWRNIATILIVFYSYCQINALVILLTRLVELFGGLRASSVVDVGGGGCAMVSPTEDASDPMGK